MNFLSYLKDSDAALHAVYIISGRFVTGMLVHVGGGNRQVEFADTRPLSIEDHNDPSLRLVGVKKTLADVIAQMAKQDVGVPTHVNLFLGAPWGTSLVRTHTENYEKPHAYTHKLEKTVLSNAIEQFQSAPGHSDIRYHLVQSGIIGVSLNGYSLPDPYGKKAEEITMQLWLTLVQDDFYRQITTILGREYHRPAHIYSLEEALVAGLGKLANPKEKTAYLLLGSEYSHLVLEDRSRQRHVVQIKSGFDDWYRIIQSDLGKSYIQARSLLRLYDRNQLEDSLRMKVEQALGRGIHAWFLSLRNEVFQSHEIHIPIIKDTDELLIITKEIFGEMVADFLKTDPAKEVFAVSTECKVVDSLSFQDSVKVSGLSLSTAAINVAATLN